MAKGLEGHVEMSEEHGLEEEEPGQRLCCSCSGVGYDGSEGGDSDQMGLCFLRLTATRRYVKVFEQNVAKHKENQGTSPTSCFVSPLAVYQVCFLKKCASGFQYLKKIT